MTKTKKSIPKSSPKSPTNKKKKASPPPPPPDWPQGWTIPKFRRTHHLNKKIYNNMNKQQLLDAKKTIESKNSSRPTPPLPSPERAIDNTFLRDIMHPPHSSKNSRPTTTPRRLWTPPTSPERAIENTTFLRDVMHPHSSISPSPKTPIRKLWPPIIREVNMARLG